MTPQYKMVSNQKRLMEVVRHLNNAQSVAMDLEADSMFHYREKVCLIQVAQNDHRWLIDPLAVTDLSPLVPVFADESIEKIFHGADYDIRSLYRDFGIKINNLFDTEMACRFLGIAQTGLAHVLEERFHVRIDKKYQRKDWSKRPLPKKMLDYAMGDVAHLVVLADALKKELRAAGRFDWVKEECRLLCQVRPVNREKRPLFLRFSGAGKLDRRSLAVLEALLIFRDEVAQTKDRPVFKVLGNHSLLQLALKKPTTRRELKKARVLSDKQISMYAENIVSAVNSAMAIPSTALPVYPRPQRVALAAGQAKRMKALKTKREAMAEAYAMDPGMLINNAQIAVIAALNPTDRNQLLAIEGIRSWQAEVLGADFLKVLNGKTAGSDHKKNEKNPKDK